MIITRTPFRVSLAGGGSDLASFYRRHEGCVLSTTIDKYMYVSIHPSFNRDETIIKYKVTENTHSLDEIKHPVARELLKDFGVQGVEVTSTADIPSGTGLSSSSAYTVGLAAALNAFVGKYRSQADIAAKACEIEIERLNQPIGKQDQYGCALGGMKFITFHPDETVDVERLVLSQAIYQQLNDSLLLFYTGNTHDAADILREQNNRINDDEATFNSLVAMAEKAKQMRLMLLEEDLSGFGTLLDELWQLKRGLASGITAATIDDYYQRALASGALGGKLLGAGGGGFLLLYCPSEKQASLRAELSDLVELPFSFDSSGTKVIYVGGKNWD